MSLWWINVFAAVMISSFCAGFLIPKILLISFRKKLFDVPDERKIHQGVVPRLGGIAFAPVALFTLFLVFGVNIVGGFADYMPEWEQLATKLSFGICSLLTLYLVGIADDLIGVRYRAKFVVQILCAIMIVSSGLWIDNMHGILGLYELPPIIGYLLTIFIIVFVLNAINLIDGIDGLASGLSAVALLFYGIVFMRYGMHIYGIIAFSTMGTLIPFFYYNVFGNPNRGRKIFMGDTGSLTIGITLSYLALAIEETDVISNMISDANIMIIAFAPLIIPCFDVVRIVIHRIRDKKNPFLPDKNHIHHKLLRLGMSQRKAMVTIVVSAVIFTFANMALSEIVNANIIFIGDIVLYTVLNIWLTKRIKKREKSKSTI